MIGSTANVKKKLQTRRKINRYLLHFHSAMNYSYWLHCDSNKITKKYNGYSWKDIRSCPHGSRESNAGVTAEHQSQMQLNSVYLYYVIL